jgi:hypothetical protein
VDPGSGVFLTPGSGMGKKSESGMNNPDHISERLETIFRVKILKILIRMRDAEWKKFGSGILDRKNSDPGWKIGSGINISIPQYWSIYYPRETNFAQL